jgi:hypothetical protein
MTLFTDFIKLVKKYPKSTLTILAIIIAIIIIILIVVDNKVGNDEVNIPPINNSNIINSEGVCSSCQFLNGMKDQSNMKCSPTEQQLDIIKNMDADTIKHCGENICLPEMNDLLIDCFSSINPVCTNCTFKEHINKSCMKLAYNSIKDLTDNDKTILQKRLYVSDACGCVPTIDHIELQNTLFNKNITDDDNPEMDNINNKCILEKYFECEDCEFFSKMFTDCITDTYEETNLNRKKIFANQCGCLPSDSQLSILDDLKTKNINYKDCVSDYEKCNLTSFANKCLNNTTPPTSYEPTEPPGFEYPPNCSNCDFLNFMESGNVSNGLEASDGNDKYYITLACECTPTETQLGVVRNIIDANKQLETCVTDKCDEIKVIWENC